LQPSWLRPGCKKAALHGALRMQKTARHSATLAKWTSNSFQEPFYWPWPACLLQFRRWPSGNGSTRTAARFTATVRRRRYPGKKHPEKAARRQMAAVPVVNENPPEAAGPQSQSARMPTPQAFRQGPQLEAKKKQADEEEAAKKKADEDKVAAAKADNCERAKKGLSNLQSGARLSITNAKGEREVMDDAPRQRNQSASRASLTTIANKRWRGMAVHSQAVPLVPGLGSGPGLGKEPGPLCALPIEPFAARDLGVDTQAAVDFHRGHHPAARALAWFCGPRCPTPGACPAAPGTLSKCRCCQRLRNRCAGLPAPTSIRGPAAARANKRARPSGAPAFSLRHRHPRPF
jgi:hypothetical protein